MPPLSPGKKRCLRDGCKALPMAGSSFCHAHNPSSVKSGGAPTGNQNARTHGLYSRYLTDEERALLSATENEASAGLDEEIAMLRIQISRALAAGADPTKSILAVGRLKQIQRQLEGEGATGIVEAVNQILSELGLGG